MAITLRAHAGVSSRKKSTLSDRASRNLLLRFRPPYDWPALHGFLAARAIPGVEAAGPGFYARSLRLEGQSGTVRVSPAPEGDALVAAIRFPDSEAIPEIGARLRRLFDLDADPRVIGAQLSTDPVMAGLVSARPGLRVPGAWDGFELAVRGILGQQVSVAAATRLAGKLAAAFGARLPPQEHGLTHAFPAPEALVEADVALALNMPRARGAAIRGIAAAALAEPDLFALGQGLEAAVVRLTRLRGIGAWTAHYIAMRALREADALPAADIGLLRALDTGSGRPTPADLIVRAEGWRPWRAYAAMHLWASDAEREAARVEAKTRR